MRDSFFILLLFLAGVGCAFLELIPPDMVTAERTLYALWLFMFIVGLKVGSDSNLPEIIRSVQPGVLMLPVLTTVGTYGGVLIVGLVCGYGLYECLAIGAGFGYYSLSSILISQYGGAEHGAVALLANMLRELTVLVLAPLIYQRLGAMPLVCAGGCTTSDTTLPVILRYAGAAWLAPAILHAVVLDFSVPFWVTLFCSLGY